MLYWLRSSCAIWSKASFSLSDLVAYINDAAAGLRRELLHFAIAGVSTETVKAAIGDQQHVADGIGLLRGFDRIIDLELAALIFSVGEQDHGFASDFLGELIVGGEIDRVVEYRSLGIGTARQRSSTCSGKTAATGRRRVDAGAVEGLAQAA